MMHNKFSYANEMQVSIKCSVTIFIFSGDPLNWGKALCETVLFRITLTVFRNLFFDVSLFSLTKCSHPSKPPLCRLQMGCWLGRGNVLNLLF